MRNRFVRSLGLTHQYAGMFFRCWSARRPINAFDIELIPLLGFALSDNGLVHPVLMEGDGLLAYAYDDDGELDAIPGFAGYVDIAATDSEVFDVLQEGLSDPHHVERISAFLAARGYKPTTSKTKGKKKTNKKQPFKLTCEMLLADGFVVRNPAVERAYEAVHGETL